jgi:hypothetical protein
MTALEPQLKAVAALLQLLQVITLDPSLIQEMTALVTIRTTLRAL